jgi:hypothetical protein
MFGNCSLTAKTITLPNNKNTPQLPTFESKQFAWKTNVGKPVFQPLEFFANRENVISTGTLFLRNSTGSFHPAWWK